MRSLPPAHLCNILVPGIVETERIEFQHPLLGNKSKRVARESKSSAESSDQSFLHQTSICRITDSSVLALFLQPLGNHCCLLETLRIPGRGR